MITDGELSLSQQTKGRKILLSFSFLNGVALTFITGNVLSLYLLKVGCTTPVVAIIASFGYLGTLFALAGKNTISRLGAGLTLRIAWVFCGLTAIILALIPFLEYLNFNKNIIMLLITCITFLFFVFKSIGTATTQPLMGEFTNSDNRGDFSSKYFFSYTMANILAMLCVIGFFSWHKTLIIFQLLILLGGLIKIACSCLFIGLNETEVPRNSARSIVTKKLLKTIWENKSYRNFLFCRSFSRAGLILIVPISILALKQLYGVSDLVALIFAFVQLGGGILITYLNGIISEETGPKPLLIIYVMLLFVISLLWIFAPDHFNWGFCFIIFFVGGVCLCGMDSCLNYFYLTIIPRENSVGISLWYTVIGGAVAGIAGLFLGGGLIKIMSLFVANNNVFKFYYGIMLVLMIPVFYIVYRQKSSSSWSLRDVLKLSIDPHEMHTLYVLHKLQKFSSAEDELKNVQKLESMDSDLSQERLLYYLESPRYIIKIHALRALYGRKLNAHSIEVVLNILKYGEYSGAFFAAILLADNNVKEAVPLLRKYLNTKDLHLLSTSIKALVKLEDKESYPKIIDIYKKINSPQVLIYTSAALSMMDDINMLRVILDKFVFLNKKTKDTIKRGKENDSCTDPKEYAQTMYIRRDSVNNEILCSVAELAGVGNIFYEFLRIYKNHNKTGILNLEEVLSTVSINNDLQKPQQIINDYSKGKIGLPGLIDYLKTSADTLNDNSIASILCDFFKTLKPRHVNIKFIYCLFMVLFLNKK